MLYSIYPPEVVFADQRSLQDPAPASLEMSSSVQASVRYHEIIRGGARLVVHKGRGGKAKVIRLISTDPFDYLNPRYAPGTEIEL